MNPLLRARNLFKSFAVEQGILRREAGRVAALTDVSFDLNAGESLGLVGESGSGKTTLARILAGFLSPDQGGFLWDERPLELFSRQERAARVQMIFQDPAASLNPKLSVRTLVGEALRRRATWDGRSAPGGRLLDRAVEEALDAVGLPAEAAFQYPHQFSGGQRQRVAIARALAARPKLLIADEPVSALDLSVQANILNLLADLREKFQLTLILISHDLTVVRHMTDNILVLDGGRAAEAGPTASVLAHPESPVTRALLDAVPALLR